MKKVLTAICILGILLGGSRVMAEITSPYTVDEKSRVSFADMTVVSSYQGLENYQYEYVGGYLHITFTYTHHVLTFSSYSPRLYITALNPTTTSSPTVRATNVILQLLAGTHGTDWYEYDVQFDATGYTTVVTKGGATEVLNAHVTVTGQTDTDNAALANTFNIAPSTLFSMSFTPRLVHEVVVPPAPTASTQSSSRSGDRLRCVETNIGIYCPSEEVREWETKERMEQLIGLLQVLVRELEKESYLFTNSV